MHFDNNMKLKYQHLKEKLCNPFSIKFIIVTLPPTEKGRCFIQQFSWYEIAPKQMKIVYKTYMSTHQQERIAKRLQQNHDKRGNFDT